MKIKLEGAEWGWIEFKYERLPTFCFMCGKVGHSEKFCEFFFQNFSLLESKRFGAWLRTPLRRNQNAGNRWLREDFGEDVPEVDSMAKVEVSGGVLSKNSGKVGVQTEIMGHVLGIDRGDSGGSATCLPNSPVMLENHTGMSVDDQEGVVIFYNKRCRKFDSEDATSGEFMGQEVGLVTEVFRPNSMALDSMKNQMKEVGLVTPISYLAWNCRGLANPRAIRILLDLVSTHKPSLVFLSETLALKNRLSWIGNKLGFKEMHIVERIGRGGGLALLWSDTVTVEILDSCLNFIDFIFCHESLGRWRCTGFYGCPKVSRRKETSQMLRSLVQLSSLPWCILGDFNCILHSSEKRGGQGYPQWLVSGFRNAIIDCGLSDIGFDGHPFTWE